MSEVDVTWDERVRLIVNGDRTINLEQPLSGHIPSFTGWDDLHRFATWARLLADAMLRGEPVRLQGGQLITPPRPQRCAIPGGTPLTDPCPGCGHPVGTHLATRGDNYGRCTACYPLPIEDR